jgi:hypothetical protein
MSRENGVDNVCAWNGSLCYPADSNRFDWRILANIRFGLIFLLGTLKNATKTFTSWTNLYRGHIKSEKKP